jgi:hypothetical protein
VLCGSKVSAFGGQAFFLSNENTRISRPVGRLSPETFIQIALDEDTVDAEYQVPSAGWEAFQLCAERRGVDARSWLTVTLADGLSRDISIGEMLRWLFPSKAASPEVQTPRMFGREAV